jgi:hypothetical protein
MNRMHVLDMYEMMVFCLPGAGCPYSRCHLSRCPACHVKGYWDRMKRHFLNQGIWPHLG